METKQAARPGAEKMGWRSFFRVKSLDLILADADRPEHQLRRALGPVQLTLFGVGAIIGTGIYATIGTAAAGDQYRPGAGPALMLSFVITAVVCAFTALCYAEFAAMVPISGSAYTYSYATLGEVIAWVIGWDLIIEYAVGNIAVAISWANYFKAFVKGFQYHGHPIVIPDWISMDYRTAAATPGVFDSAPHLFGKPIVFNLLSILIVTLITIVLVWGVRESARFNAVMVVIKIAVLIFFVGVGYMWIKPTNYTPFAPNGWAGISAGAAIVFFAYIGFDAVSTVAEETKNPQRNLPLGIISSLVVCTVFYVVVSAIFSGLISYPDLKTQSPSDLAEALTMALRHASPNSNFAIAVVGFGSIIAQTAVLLVFQLGQPRIFFSMSRDGLLPPFFSRVHPRFRTPHVATIITGIFVGGFAAIASLDEVVDLTNIGTLFAFILVCAGIIILRVKDPNRHRPFRVPSGWFWTILLYAGFAIGIALFPMSFTAKVMTLGVSAVIFVLSRNNIFPVLGILTSLYLVYYLPPTSWLRFAAWLNFGFVIYIGYGAVNSRLTGRQHSDRPEEHNAHTAYTGACLAIIGVVLLLVMRALDIGIASKDTGVIAGIFSAAPWLETSWFLIVPLALNALVLCPIIIRRSLNARRDVNSQEYAPQTSFSLAVSIILALASLAYFVILLMHNANVRS